MSALPLWAAGGIIVYSLSHGASNGIPSWLLSLLFLALGWLGGIAIATIRLLNQFNKELIQPVNTYLAQHPLAHQSENGTDISQLLGTMQEQTEALHREEARLKRYLDSSSVAIVITNADKSWRYFNDAACRLLGRTRDELAQVNWELITHPEDKASSLGVYKQMLCKEIPEVDFEKRYLRPDSSIVYARVIAHAIEEEDGKVSAVISYLLDVSARVRAEREALEIRDQLHAIFDTAADGILVLNEEGLIETANPAAEHLMGISSVELSGRNIAQFFSSCPPQLISFHPQFADNCLLPRLSKTQCYRRDGVNTPVEVSISEFLAGGRPYFAGIFRDITAQEQTQEELRRARDDAEAALRAKSDFLAVMSHEIRTPLNGVIGMAQLLTKTKLNAEQRDYLSSIVSSGQTLLSLINDILDFSKIEAGKVTIEPIPFDLQKLIEEVADLMNPRVVEKNLELIFHYSPSTEFRLIGDPGRLRQILLNLVSNAIKFTKQGHIYLDIATIPTHDSVKLAITVEDTGIGIAEEKLPLLFQKFSQADPSTTRRFGGTGLGLAICKALTELMHGDIWIRSVEGSGSVFGFYVMLQKDNRPIPSAKQLAELRGVRVLILDDMETNRRFLREALNQQEMEVTEARTLSGAWQALEAAHKEGLIFQVAVLDDQLGDGTGMQFARRMKQDARFTKMKLVMLTSVTQRGDARLAQQAGFGAYLVKPVRVDHMVTALSMLLGNPSEELITRHQIEEQKVQSARERQNSRNTEGSHILLVEDNPVNQMVALKMLKSLGCKVDVAENGKMAVELYDAGQYDLVLMDCQMPEMDGYEATRIIRSREKEERIPIIALTANSLNEDKRRCEEAGMDDFLAKPIRQSQLLETLERHLPTYSGSPT